MQAVIVVLETITRSSDADHPENDADDADDGADADDADANCDVDDADADDADADDADGNGDADADSQALETYKAVHRRFPDNVECLKFLVRLSSEMMIKNNHHNTENNEHNTDHQVKF